MTVCYHKEKDRIKEAIRETLKSHFGRSIEEATKNQLYKACAMTLRDEIMDKWHQSNKDSQQSGDKQLFYLSIEFLMGRAMGNNLINMLRDKIYHEAIEELGINLDELLEVEPDAGLGNGGLGRLAACFLDSLATMGLPGHGFGLRYQYGLFQQRIVDGFQIEMPDAWLDDGNVWEIPRPEEQKEVRFGGKVIETWENGRALYRQEDCMTVIAVPYDTPITGYGSDRVNTLRLWSAKSPKYLDMSWFSRGDYVRATEEKELAEVISKVLYPEDNHREGKALRLKQHYFFVSASMQCIIGNDKKNYGDLRTLPDRVAIQINDTHPALAIPEMMRILLDQEGMDWDTAWDITTRTFAYTNHTIMSEALERWPQQLFRELLPRIHMIVSEINERYCRKLWERFPGLWKKISDMAIIAYDEVRMAPLSIVGSHSVNGVASLHTQILKNEVFKDYNQLEPYKFTNITNGITQRRWLLKANPGLSGLLHETIGDAWIKEPWRLKELEPYARDAAFREAFARVKLENKKVLARYVKDANGVDLDVSSIFDVQVKRLHEYKRQLLNILHVMYLYNRLSANPNEDIHPRTFLFGAKASPGYHRAKQIIKLINTVAEKIQKDKRISEVIKVVFLENYRVSLAEKIIPAADVSEQISTAGKEASGTGNMKFMMNGALTIGTLDGANIEMKKAVGEENIFIFGLKAEEVSNYYRYDSYHPRAVYEEHQQLKKVVDQLVDGTLDPENTSMFADIYRSLLYGNGGMADPYMVLADFEAYSQTQERVQKVYRDKDSWYQKAIVNAANSGFFSSDRSIREYNSKIWHLRL
jgi:starch phosphorylase